MDESEWDFVIVGSGFGGSTAALRLAQKGYRVVVVEQGAELSAAEFPRSNWDLRRYLWLPWVGFRGLFNVSLFRHVTVLSGVGVGGGSLVYACTHPVPPPSFFESPAWADLADWRSELEPHYREAKRMLGVTQTPFVTPTDRALQSLATRLGTPEAFKPTDVAVYFGTPGETVPDPYLDGEGPDRTGCIRCGGCMLGCRHNAKNSLDKNYLWLARRRGVAVHSNTRVVHVRPRGERGYLLRARRGTYPLFSTEVIYRAKQVIFAGGVMGTVPLLMRLQRDPAGLPKLSTRLGRDVRTNSESLIGVVSRRADVDLAQGIAIGSILETDEHSHLEPVRYPAGSGLFRVLIAPHVAGEDWFSRIARLVSVLVRHPLAVARALTVRDFAKQTVILLYMRSLDSTLRLERAWHGGLTTRADVGPAPRASMKESTELAAMVGEEIDGMPFSLVTETLFNIPTTAHILGGCCMGADVHSGVIDRDHRVFGYPGLYVIDGSAVSANPGVNPSLTIVALAERALSKIPAKATLASERTG